MKFNRASGILLHPTSLPGPYGIGDIGPAAHQWIDFLSDAGCGLWQVLPLGPTGYGDSPYQSFSAFGGNPYLISPDDLITDGLLTREDLQDRPYFQRNRVDYGTVIEWKLKVLDRAYERFKASANPQLQEHIQSFRREQANWLDDYALFMAIKEAQGGGSWSKWPLPLKKREMKALDDARQEFKDSIDRHVFRQFIFFRQWAALKKYANTKGIQIIGDIPIFVAHDSADVWANTELFHMDEEGNPTVVAGVPPDYFSPTGQLWGNPLYRWDLHASTGYQWWLERFQAVLHLVDIVRLDHFRGFAGYWEVPAGKPTAEIGQWVPGPGIHFFQSVCESLGELPILAEDLGVITPDVVEMREHFNLPGMKIFQFAFANKPDDPFLPHNYPQNCVVYSGTHDNDTAIGWYNTAPEEERQFFRQYTDLDVRDDIAWTMIRSIWSSVAIFSLAPMQDFLSLGSEARMNFPGKASGNWQWRLTKDQMSQELGDRIRRFNFLYSRLVEKTEPPPKR